MKNQKSIKERILEKIKAGEIKMRPKIHYVLKTILIVGCIVLLGGVIVFLISFIHFHLRASGIRYLPEFGWRGLGIYLRLLPWLLIFISAVLILALEILAKRFTPVWRKPVLYSLLAIILLALVGGFLVAKTPFHPRLFWQARQGKLLFMAPVYREFGTPRFKNVHRGLVEELTEDGFLLRKTDDELLKIIVAPETQFPFDKEIKESDSVVVMGERENDTVRAFGILKIDDEFRTFERRLLRPPMELKK